MTTQPSRLPVAPLAWGVAVPVLLWACFFAGLIYLVPGYKKTFNDFGVRLPAAAETGIAIADWAETYWYVLPLWLVFVIPADVALIVGLWRAGRRGLVWLWCGLLVALPVVALLLAFVAIYLPLTKLYEGLSK